MTPSQKRKIDSLKASDHHRGVPIEVEEMKDGRVKITIHYSDADYSYYIGKRGGLTFDPIILQEDD